MKHHYKNFKKINYYVKIYGNDGEMPTDVKNAVHTNSHYTIL